MLVSDTRIVQRGLETYVVSEILLLVLLLQRIGARRSRQRLGRITRVDDGQAVIVLGRHREGHIHVRAGGADSGRVTSAIDGNDGLLVHDWEVELVDTSGLPFVTTDAELSVANAPATVLGRRIGHGAQREDKAATHDRAESEGGRTIDTLETWDGLQEEDGFDKVGGRHNDEVDETVAQEDLDQVCGVSELRDLSAFYEGEDGEDSVDDEGG